MQVLQEDSVSHPIASLRNATTSGGEDKLARAAALVSVSNRIRHEDVPRLLDAAGAVIGQLASAETVIRIADTNPDAIWIFSRKGRDRAEGFVATLLLNEAGRIALFDGSLDLLDPQPQYLAAQHESPSIIYVWASYTPGLMAAGIPRVFDRFDSPHYAQTDIVSTSDAARNCPGLGEAAIAGVVQLCAV